MTIIYIAILVNAILNYSSFNHDVRCIIKNASTVYLYPAVSQTKQLLLVLTFLRFVIYIAVLILAANFNT